MVFPNPRVACREALKVCSEAGPDIRKEVPWQCRIVIDNEFRVPEGILMAPFPGSSHSERGLHLESYPLWCWDQVTSQWLVLL